MALYEHGGTGSAFEIDCGLKMFGSGSREYCDKKSFKLLFKNQYEGQLAYDVFGDGDATVFERGPLVKLVEEGQLMSYMHKGYWQCMDTRREKDILENHLNIMELKMKLNKLVLT